MTRKSSVVVSLSWILIAIIGVLFLVMTVKLIDKYRTYQDNKFKVEFKKVVNDLFRRIGEKVEVEENKAIEIDYLFSGRELEPICVHNMTILKVGDIYDSNNEFFKSNPIFLHTFKVNKADPVFLLVQRYRLPFPIVNLFILTSPKILIVFIDPKEVGDHTYSEMVSDFFKSSFSELNAIVVKKSDLPKLTSKISAENIQRVVIVNGVHPNLAISSLNLGVPIDLYSFNFLRSGEFLVTSVVINDSQSQQYYHVSFLDYGDDFALSKSILFADPDTLNCSLSSLYSALRVSYDFYYEKSKLICGMIDKDRCSGSTVEPIESNISKVCENPSLTGDIFIVGMYKDVENRLKRVDSLLNGTSNMVNLASAITDLEMSERSLEESGCIGLY